MPTRSALFHSFPIFWLLPIATGLCLVGLPPAGRAQELEPGAYSPSPIDFNILLGSFTFNTGDLAFDPSAPITEASATIGAGAVGYVRTLGLFGRMANAGLYVPYVDGDLAGIALGEYQEVNRTGVGDPRVRFSVNLIGGPAMTVKEFVGYKPKWILGTSLVVVAPFGQYYPDKLINIGGNRWAFKPEIGLSRTVGKWRFEGDLGAWFFTDNTDFFGGKTRSQDAIVSAQFHLVYTFRPRMWLAYDANYYVGGETKINGGRNADLQNNSRMGLTFALPVNRTNSLKFSYSVGAFTSIGAKFQSFGLAWQVVWGPTR